MDTCCSAAATFICTICEIDDHRSLDLSKYPPPTHYKLFTLNSSKQIEQLSSSIISDLSSSLSSSIVSSFPERVEVRGSTSKCSFPNSDDEECVLTSAHYIEASYPDPVDANSDGSDEIN